MKKIIRIILGLFIAASLVYLVMTELRTPETEKAENKTEKEKTTETQQADRLDIYYFHATARCNSCLKIEKYTRSTIETDFKNELKNGKIVFKLVNIEEEKNQHFITDFKLYTKSVIIQQIKNGKPVKWVNLDKIWDLLDNETQFSLYIQDEVKRNLTEAEL